MTQTYETIDSGREGSLARTAMLDYGLHIAGLLLSMGILSVVALIINYVKRPSSRGTLFESHFTWQIRTFWWTLLWLVVLAVPVMLTLGITSFLFLIPAIWYLYRMIKGLLYLNDRKPMPV
jgi:uncharacterized membrane protein